MRNVLITPDAVIRRSAAIIHTDLGDETAMMDMDKGLYYGLDDTGSRLWALVEKPITVRHLCESLRSEYSVGAEQCEEEVIQFLNVLLNHGVVEVVDNATP